MKSSCDAQQQGEKSERTILGIYAMLGIKAPRSSWEWTTMENLKWLCGWEQTLTKEAHVDTRCSHDFYRRKIEKPPPPPRQCFYERNLKLDLQSCRKKEKKQRASERTCSPTQVNAHTLTINTRQSTSLAPSVCWFFSEAPSYTQ